MEPNEKAKELTEKYLSEGYDMRDALIEAQSYCVGMTVEDWDNQMFWAMTGIKCYLAICEFDKINKSK